MATLKYRFTICLLFAITVFAGCTHREPVTDEEAKTTAAVIEKAARNQKPEALLNLFDLAMLRENVARQDGHISKANINAAVSEDALNQFATSVLGAVKDGSYKLIRTYDTGGVRHMVFRMFGETGLNYHDFPLYKINGKIKAADVFNFVSGEDISKTFAGLLGSDPTMTGNGTSGAGKAFLEIMRLKNEKDYKGEMEAIKNLDPAVRKTKAMQMTNIMAAKNVGMDDYKMALEEFAGLYPNEAGTYLLMLDVYYMNKQYDKAMFAVNKLDTLVKGDPVLNLFRGNIYRDMNDTAQSRISYEKCFAYDPYIKNNMQQLVVTYVEANEMDKAKATIEKYRQNPRFKDEDVADLYTLYPSLK